jgi:hypothetical protein
MIASVQKINERNDDGTLTSTFIGVYKVVLNDGTTTNVPHNPANRHYDEIQRQVAAGTLTIADAD